jgi:hypothetical protein
MNPALALLLALVLLACLGEAGIFTTINYLNRRAAAANRVRTKRLPRQLAERWADFDENGRPY